MLLREVMEEQVEEAGMDPLVIAYNWRYQYELMFSSIIDICTYISLLYQQRRPRSNNTPVTASTLSNQILVSNTIHS